MGMERWLERHGRALAVLIALVCAGYFAGSTHVPQPVPDFALGSGGIYRLEIGAVFFVACFLAVMAFLQALSGKGFPKFESEDQIEDPASDSSSRR
jgi:hypothetical protein